ncbi:MULTISPECIES: hypothetical protein [Streptomyces]|uniref:hypothetical protein n=1 Tax=Streptomyces TaxID=1883 RepID=UPI002044F880|nr:MULTISPECIES: hypothetical protein [Streptomyces]UPT41764.1 hypothetical protein MWG59_10185 [Streptomyces sp. WAC00303]WIY75996.1 hypothetical protein QPM16_10045 [Streptomyces anulatus]
MTTTPRTWASGETPSGTTFNTEVRDQWNSILDAWTPYTPTWSGATTNPVIGNGTLVGRYMKIGRSCKLRIEMLAGSLTTYGSGGWSLTLPFAAAAAGAQIGIAHTHQSQRIGGAFTIAPGANVGLAFFPTTGSPALLSWVASTVPVTWASGGRLSIYAEYETAT